MAITRKSLAKLFLVRIELYRFLKSSSDKSALPLQKEVWVSKLCFMISILFYFSLQGKDRDIFDVMGKIESMKFKIHLWQDYVLKGNFSIFCILKTK